MQGTIQLYFPLKAYGFILINFRDRIFFHLCDYKGDVEPVGGMLVNYDVGPPKHAGQRNRAVNVTPITPISPTEGVKQSGGAL